MKITEETLIENGFVCNQKKDTIGSICVTMNTNIGECLTESFLIKDDELHTLIHLDELADGILNELNESGIDCSKIWRFENNSIEENKQIRAAFSPFTRYYSLDEEINFVSDNIENIKACMIFMIMDCENLVDKDTYGTEFVSIVVSLDNGYTKSIDVPNIKIQWD